MAVTYHFETMTEMADHIEGFAKAIRARVPNALHEASKRTMRAEAHAYEQAAMIIRNARLAIWINRHSLTLTGVMFLPILFGIILAIELFKL